MKITQIRNAAIKLEYAGRVFLIDAWLADKGSMGRFADYPYRPIRPEMENIPMPIHGLPMSIEKILDGVEAYVLTHIHPDHIDMEPDGGIGRILPKNIPLFAQSVEDAEILLKHNFTDITVLYENSYFHEASLIKAPARHGTKIPCGPACGVVFKAPGEKTLYVAGDTIWYDGVKNTIEKFHPDVIIVNACGAALQIYGRLIMDAEDVEKTCKAASYATIIASHMDNVAHATIDRAGMMAFINERHLEKSVLMPEDGESLEF